jgi:acyl carrier protein
MNEARQIIRHFIDENFLFGVPTDYTDDASLMDTGIIDSTGVLELIGFLEGEFDITIADDELEPENLDTVANMVRFVSEKRRLAPAAS